MQLTPSFDITIYTDLESINLPYKLLQFSAGELHPTLGDYIAYPIESIGFTAKAYPSTFITELSLLVDAIRNEFSANIPIDLDMPYIPYSRQDRVCSKGDAFGLKVFTNQLNSLNFRYVAVLDAHSDVATALINNCVARTSLDILALNSSIMTKYSHLISPDAGAYKKTSAIGSYFNLPVIPALKTRDTATGRLSNTVLVTEGVTTPSRFLVVDDLVDGGFTFILLAQKLKERFPSTPLDLYVSQGIFSKGTDELLKYYNTIYCANLFTPTNGVTTLE